MIVLHTSSRYANDSDINGAATESTLCSSETQVGGGEVEHIIPNPRGEFEELCKSADNAKAIIGGEPRIPLAKASSLSWDGLSYG